MTKLKIVFPEWENAIIQEAVRKFDDIEALKASDLEQACQQVRTGEADAMVAGIDYTSREVILACRDEIGMTGKTFTSCFVLTRGEEKYVLADVATCKNPSEEQLFDIVMQTYETAQAVLGEEPKIAMLSFSTLGSGGFDPSIDRAKAVINRIQKEYPTIKIEGEMQLDAAICARVGDKKAPGSTVAGQANVLICPDLNSGNILYKAMEQFGGFVAAGPILQGFKAPVSDLSRGSTVEDVELVIEIIKKLAERKNG